MIYDNMYRESFSSYWQDTIMIDDAITLSGI